MSGEDLSRKAREVTLDLKGQLLSCSGEIPTDSSEQKWWKRQGYFFIGS
jgi:hypothetical protein